ncbi:cryptochrome/photolyase family protein [Massilia sp. TS11]|uniref:cryptochrome/photolyase family protein n=1 Tax=Massilia sp. TS11 TaxID=2908003 RepID=UPI001ED9FE83|nr:cryptochrome/photolyase family protein [Massilia sp. TS11]MCG2585054.1 cryptochrome/photolyase family protein [Massilia sp. TS11]
MSARTLRLILGDQLSLRHSWFQHRHADVVYLMMEVRQETDYVLHHAQKILAIFAAMRQFAAELEATGHRVHYLRIGDADNTQSLTANLEAALARFGASECEYQMPDEWRLEQQLAAWRPPGVRVRMVGSEHFYTAPDEAAGIFAGRQRWLMEHFYRTLRVRHQVLMEADGQPVGGKWNYDHDNRKPWKGDPPEPPDRRPCHDRGALWEEITAAGVQSFGNPQAGALRWPASRAEALQQLAHFIARALPHFGDFQDAMSSRARRLFHSQLSFALNVKLLDPREVVQAAQAAWEAGQAPVAAVEGFIRQILGWREYVRGVYWARMPAYAEHNVLRHALPLPRWFWTGQTGMRCLAQAIGDSLEEAHAHHIQRLMVIGNFALLAGLDPQAVHRWYLGVYIDAFEWVELPNTLGMSQFADGGLLATKPYVSSAAYIDRMSDYCQGCRYDKKRKTGHGACPFNALYWDFFARHQDQLGDNPRIGMVYPQLRKMDPEALAALRQQAALWREKLDDL